MSEAKLSSEQVPPKFAEWLLEMGCPPEDVPPLDKISEMCRGQYYMVWRSLMEHVGPKDTILSKRLQVFNNDIVKCQKNVYNEYDTNMPKELCVWRQHSELTEQVADAEARVADQRDNLNQLLNKNTSKLARRDLATKRLQDAQRRSWLLQQVSAELRERKRNLLETKTIADSLCCLVDNQDVERRLDKCISALSRAATSRACAQSVATPAACSSIASTGSDNEAEDLVSSLAKCRGDVVFKQVLERRAALCGMVAARADPAEEDRSPQCVVARTAALHCALALGALRHRHHLKQTSTRLAATVMELTGCLGGEARELLVLRCARAGSEARAHSLRVLCDEINSRDGPFFVSSGEHDAANISATQLHNIDKSVAAQSAAAARLAAAAAALDRKTRNVKGGLVAIFNSFHQNEQRLQETNQSSVATPPPGSMSSLRHFFKERREKLQNKVDLSMDLDVSDSRSYNGLTDTRSPKFVDELRMYLKKFRLEKNRKLVLESGEQIWIFETIQSSLDRLHAKWQDDDVTTSIICPSVSLAHNLARLAQEVTEKTELEAVVRSLEDGGKKLELSLDISSLIEEQQITLDQMKKRLNDNIVSLQRSGKALSVGMEHLTLWAEDTVKQYISVNRTVDGRTLKEYERAYLQSLRG